MKNFFSHRMILVSAVISLIGLMMVITSSIFAADIRFAVSAALLAQKHQKVISWGREIKNQPFTATAEPLQPGDIEGLIPRIEALADLCSETRVIKHKIPVECQQLTEVAALLNQAEPFIEDHLQSSHTYLVLLQNSEELRASGGFMGSFARVTVGSNGIESFEIQDIYEPDGQFAGYVPAPPGVFEYLSSGNGLRLPDANWAADFPSAAQTILAYFSFGDQSSVDGLVAINSSLIEKMLAITGDIYLPDYDTNVSTDTFTQLARSNRDEFFPGSKQKQHFLTSLMTQLKIRFSELSQNQQQQLAYLILDSITVKDTLFYSTDPQLQSFFEQHQAAGTLAYPSDVDSFLYLVESNVGINKANKAVERQIDVGIDDYQAIITSNFSNNNPTQPPADSNDDNLNYANYQRVIVPPGWQLHSINIDGKQLDEEQIADNVITSSSGEQFRQIGYLHITEAQKKSTSTVRFSKLAQNIQAESHRIFLQKQPGQKLTPYQISWRNTQQTILLDQDSTIQLSTNN